MPPLARRELNLSRRSAFVLGLREKAVGVSNGQAAQYKD